MERRSSNIYRKNNKLVELSELILWHEIKNYLNIPNPLSKKTIWADRSYLIAIP